VSLSESGRHQIRLIDLKTNREDPLELPGLCWFPRWHSDAKRLAYASMQKGDFDVYWKDVTSAAPPEKLLVTDFDEMPFAFFPKGDAVIVEQSNSEGGYRPMLLPLNPVGTPRPVGAHAVESVSVSPDGNWIAYVSSPGGPDEAYLVPATGGVPDRLSTGGAQAVAWSSQQTELFYLRAPEIVAVSFRLENGRLRRVGERVWARVEGNYTDDVFQQNVDGRILVALSKDSSPREIRVVTNWASEIARKFK
jgi:hypothetical protein